MSRGTPLSPSSASTFKICNGIDEEDIEGEGNPSVSHFDLFIIQEEKEVRRLGGTN